MMNRFGWILKMAWRDSRRQRGRLLLLVSSIVLGIGAMVAIQSFGENLQQVIKAESKELLGADLSLQSQYPITDEAIELLDSLGIELSREISFGSMVRFMPEGNTRLVNVRAIEGNYPFYGEITTQPANLTARMRSEAFAIADETLMLQFNAKPGDSAGIGSLMLPIFGSALKVPGQSGITGSVAPPVFMPYRLAEASGLLQKGSRINYSVYGKYPEGFDQSIYETIIVPRIESTEIRLRDVAAQQERTGQIYSDLTGFLNLTAFVALLLGCVGVASAVNVYAREKVKAAAMLRCLGASGNESAAIFIVQIVGVAVPAALIGVVAGNVLQWFLPSLFAEFIPLEVAPSFSFSSALAGFLTGVVTAFLFALQPMSSIRNISPLETLRTVAPSKKNRLAAALIYALIAICVFFFAWFQSGSLLQAVAFVIGLVVSFSLLTLFAFALMRTVRRFFPSGASFVLRQGLSSLYRPNNQTLVLMVTIGLGAALISTLIISRDVLLNKVQLASAGSEQPNMVLFDIQDHQLNSLANTIKAADMPVIATVPVVNMRLESIKGIPASVLKKDSTSGISSRLITREYRVTYRDSLSESETVEEGQWIGRAEIKNGPVPISLEKGLAEDMRLAVGDELAFNVQGAEMNCRVASIRKVDFQRVEANFLVVFPSGVLEKAPKFHVLLTRFANPEQSAAFQRETATAFPNVSIIDLKLIIETLEDVTAKVGFVVQFMALISMLTGFLVLLASVRSSRFQRIRESVLLRTLGAGRKQVFGINAVEYLILGSIASLTGIIIAVIANIFIAKFSFNAMIWPSFTPLALIYIAITVVTVLIGMLNIRSVVRQSPLEILRADNL